MKLLKALDDRRKTLKLTLGTLSSLTGAGTSHLSRIFSGQQDPRLATLQAIATALDTELVAVPKDLAIEVRQFISSRGQTTNPSSKSAAETFLEG